MIQCKNKKIKNEYNRKNNNRRNWSCSTLIDYLNELVFKVIYDKGSLLYFFIYCVSFVFSSCSKFAYKYTII